MAKQRTPEEQAAYMREYRARKRGVLDPQSGMVTLPGKPKADNAPVYRSVTLEPGEYMRMMAEIKPETDGKSAGTVQNARMRRNVVKKAPETVENPEIALESTLKRQRANGREWLNPFNDGLPDTPILISSMTQKRRDAILDRLPKTPHR